MFGGRRCVDGSLVLLRVGFCVVVSSARLFVAVAVVRGRTAEVVIVMMAVAAVVRTLVVVMKRESRV